MILPQNKMNLGKTKIDFVDIGSNCEKVDTQQAHIQSAPVRHQIRGSLMSVVV